MSIAVIGMLDEREDGLKLIRDTIEQRGHEAALIDISIGTGAITPEIEPRVSCEEVARAGGSSIRAVRGMLAKERDKASSIMAEGLHRILQDQFAAGRLQGVIAVGGMTGTFMALRAMKSLPYGLPKLLISSVAALPVYARELSEFFGVRDITVMHTVVDTVGLNSFVRALMTNGAGAVCGMVEASRGLKKENRPSVALTEFGFCDSGAHYVRELLKENYSTVSFHATGLGEKAACDLVGRGSFEAFIDLVPGGFSEYLLGGNRATGPDRLDAGIVSGKPYILSPCGFDMISCGPLQRRDQGDPLWVSRRLSERKLLVQDDLRVQARTTDDEVRLIAREAAKRLNEHPKKSLVKWVIPVKGFSSISVEGGALHDPACDRSFVDELKRSIDQRIEIIEVLTHINTPEFAASVVDVLKKIM